MDGAFDPIWHGLLEEFHLSTGWPRSCQASSADPAKSPNDGTMQLLTPHAPCNPPAHSAPPPLQDYYTRQPRGIAFVEFTNNRDAEDALRGLDRLYLAGKEIQATFALQGRKRPDDFRRQGQPAARQGEHLHAST